MAFNASEIFQSHIANLWGPDTLDFESNTIKAALFPDSITPVQDAALAATAYGFGVWTTGSEIVSTGTPGDWPAGGRPLLNRDINTSTPATIFLDADDTASGPNATLAGVKGVLVYNDTPVTAAEKYGLSYNAFGGVQQVTAGTFTVVWAVTGIARITL